jgi:prepilin-type N-terminal cleavage/methylation domain-containing protein
MIDTIKGGRQKQGLSRKNDVGQGFTVVELLIVIVVIAILASITIVSYASVTNRAKLQTAKTDAQTVATRLNKYKADNGNYPTSQTAFNSAGLTGSTKSTFAYKYTSTPTYCIAATNSGYTAYVTNTSLIPVEGVCP